MNDISCKLNSQSFLISRRRCPKPSTTARGAKGKRQWDNGPQATSYAKFCQVMPPQPQVFWWSFHGCEGLTGLTAMVYLSNVYATDGCWLNSWNLLQKRCHSLCILRFLRYIPAQLRSINRQKPWIGCWFAATPHQVREWRVGLFRSYKQYTWKDSTWREECRIAAFASNISVSFRNDRKDSQSLPGWIRAHGACKEISSRSKKMERQRFLQQPAVMISLFWMPWCWGLQTPHMMAPCSTSSSTSFQRIPWIPQRLWVDERPCMVLVCFSLLIQTFTESRLFTALDALVA